MSSAATPALAGFPDPPAIGPGALRRSLSGFFVSGILLSFLGAILPAWQAHLTSDFTSIGKCFLAQSLGIVLGIRFTRRLIAVRGPGFSLTAASVLSAAAFLFLAFVPPPLALLWRLLGLFGVGVGAALLNAALFQALSASYARDRAAVINLAGALFGLGCMITALLVALTFYAFSVQGILILLALVPSVFAVIFARTKLPSIPAPTAPRDRGVPSLKAPLAVLLGLLLFFQFGNEWSIAGWLPVFLIRRLGASPAASLLMLACFWAALLAGRFVAQGILPRVSHPRVLVSSVLIELLGYLLLTLTDSLSGAFVGIFCLAAGFALTYPLIAVKIGSRFPHYHPGFFNGIFKFAFGGALLSPWLLGYLAQGWGIRAVMILPLIGTVAVFVLSLLIFLETFLSRNGASA